MDDIVSSAEDGESPTVSEENFRVAVYVADKLVRAAVPSHYKMGVYAQRQLKLRFFSTMAPWHAPSSHLAKSVVSGHAQYTFVTKGVPGPVVMLKKFEVIVEIVKAGVRSLVLEVDDLPVSTQGTKVKDYFDRVVGGIQQSITKCQPLIGPEGIVSKATGSVDCFMRLCPVFWSNATATGLPVA